jgi:hypothetical protein
MANSSNSSTIEKVLNVVLLVVPTILAVVNEFKK